MPKCECGVTASFGYKDGKATCCVTHKTNDMINVVDVLCLDCDKRAMYNLPGKTGGVYCISHMKVGMVNVKGKRCEFVYDGGKFWIIEHRFWIVVDSSGNCWKVLDNVL